MSNDGLRKKAEHHDHSNFKSAFSGRIPILTLNTWKLKSFSLFFERRQRNALSSHGISRVGVHINLGNGMTRQSYQDMNITEHRPQSLGSLILKGSQQSALLWLFRVLFIDVGRRKMWTFYRYKTVAYSWCERQLITTRHDSDIQKQEMEYRLSSKCAWA